MRLHPLDVVVALLPLAAGCAARAQAPLPEPALPELLPPPAPPRIVAIYVAPEEPAPVEAPPPAEPSTPVRPQPRPAAPPPAPPAAAGGVPAVTTPPPALTLTPAPGADAKTEASIRSLLSRVSRDLARVNGPSLSTDGRTQFETARRFVQQSEDALRARNLVYAGKLADKAAALVAVLAR